MKSCDLPLANLDEVPRQRSWKTPILVSIAWGCLLSLYVCRVFFRLEYGEFFENHDGDSYGVRLIEFRDCLAHGFWLPQWCSHFRGGLGAPFFSYYQPLFFYVASLTPSSWPVAHQLGATVSVFSVVGYLGILWLVSHRFGVAAGTLAATFLLTAPYIHTELYIRGDLSEYAAMMLVPGLLAALLQFCEQPSRPIGIVGALLAASVVMTHPAVALVTYGLIACWLIAIAVVQRNWLGTLRGFALLALGVGLSAVYWLPVFLESQYSSVEKMWNGTVFDGYYHYSRHFVSLPSLVNSAVTETPIPVKLGSYQTVIAVVGALMAFWKWTRWSHHQRHTTGLCLFLLSAGLFLMIPQSAFLWAVLPLMGRIQFPWRLLTLVSLAMAGVAGIGWGAFSERRWNWLGLVVLCGLLLGSTAARSNPKLTKQNEPRNASEIVDRFFAPDLADEWLPKGAENIQFDPKTLQPRTNHEARLRNYQMQTGVLECHLETTQETAVVLPHYFFSTGFVAMLGRQQIDLHRTARGLMQVDVPAGFSGTLRVEWQTSPAKWKGLAVSLLTVIGGMWLMRYVKNPAGSSRESLSQQHQIEHEYSDANDFRAT